MCIVSNLKNVNDDVCQVGQRMVIGLSNISKEKQVFLSRLQEVTRKKTDIDDTINKLNGRLAENNFTTPVEKEILLSQLAICEQELKKIEKEVDDANTDLRLVNRKMLNFLNGPSTPGYITPPY